MAYEHIGFARSDQSGRTARFPKIRALLKQRAARRTVYRTTLDELQALSDRELADFGFHRSEIPRIARRAVELAG